MKIVLKMDLYPICRICLRQQETTSDLFRTKMCREGLLFSEVSDDDGLPSELCSACATRLTDAYQLKLQAVQTDQKLHEIKRQQQHESNASIKSLDEVSETHLLNSDSEIEVNLVALEKTIAEQQVEKWVHDHKIEEQSPCSIEEELHEENGSFGDVEELEMHLVYEDSDEDDNPEDGVQFLQNVTMNNLTKSPTSAGAITGQGETKRRRRRRSKTTVHKCQVCQRIFARKSNLVDHLRLHAKVKLFQCSYCDKSFVQIGNYRTHMRIHTKERPFKCTICSKSYTQTSALKIHIRSHTQERNYVCAQCGKAFTNASDLSKHTLIHDPHKQFKCALCPRQFAQKVNMLNHQRRMHGSNGVFDDTIAVANKTHKSVAS